MARRGDGPVRRMLAGGYSVAPVGKVAQKSVRFLWAEGDTWPRLRDARPSSLADAGVYLAAAAHGVTGEGYDKVGFEIVWADGERYEGRFDLRHISHGTPDLAEHVRRYLHFMAGLFRPDHMSEEVYRSLLPPEIKRLECLGVLRDYDLS
jgi:hypothetical protein